MTGAEAERLEAEYQARIAASYSAAFLREMDAIVEAINSPDSGDFALAGREAAEETKVHRVTR